MAAGIRDLLVGNWWRYTISLLGALMLSVGVGSVLLDGRITNEEFLQVSSLVVLCLFIIALGARIAVEVRGWTQMFRILGWMSVGVLTLGALGAWYYLIGNTVETPFEIALLFLSVLAAGTLFGAIVGYYDVRVRSLISRASREEARREYLDEQQETLSSLNGILRHQILNDLSAISGRAELLAADKIDRETAIESIIDHCEHMESTVHRIETVVDVLTHVTDSKDVSAAESIDMARATAQDTYPDLTVDSDGVSDTTVRADELLHIALAELFENTAIHADGEVSVSVSETVETATIEIRDEGPGVAVSPEETLFEPNTRGPDSEGDGLGLFLADLIIDRYDGDIRLVEGDDGTTFEVEVPKDRTVSSPTQTESDELPGQEA